MTVAILVILAFVAVTAGVMSIFMFVSGRSAAAKEKAIESRLNEVGNVPMLEPGEATLVREQNEGLLPQVETAARQAIKGSKLERWLEQSGTTLSLSACFVISLSLGGVCAFLALMIGKQLWAAPIGFAVGLTLLPGLLKFKRTRRLNKFEEQFPEALDLMSRGIRAGHAFSAGMKMIADELGDPVGPEFRKAFDEQNFGLPLKESLNNLCERVPILDVRFFATAVLIQRETGGNLSEILDNLANVVRERFKIRRQIRVHTAHGRFTGYVLMALPGFLGVALSFINPEHMDMLFEDHMGQMMIMGAIVMQVVGYFWIKQVIKIEV